MAVGAKLIFHPDVAIELKASYVWYQNQAMGLGDDLVAELEAAYRAILELPDTWPPFKHGCRRFLLSKFPYSVIYRNSSNGIFVVAIMHNTRRPNYWKNRK